MMDSAFQSKLTVQRQHPSQPLVLAVEDNPDNQLLLEYILETLGCAFVLESDGSNAIALAQQLQPDLILMDIVLPNMNGFQLMRQLKRSPITSSIPVVAVTALVDADTQQEIGREGFSGYLCKPYMVEDLEQLICRYLPHPVSDRCSA